MFTIPEFFILLLHYLAVFAMMQTHSSSSAAAFLGGALPFEQCFAHLPKMNLVLSPEAVIQAVNVPYVRKTNVPPEKLVGKRYWSG